MLEASTLENRIRDVEDRLEIYNLIARHPPSADTGADYYTSVAYVEGATNDLGGGKVLTGKAIGGFQTMPEHYAAMAGGLAHFAGLPHIDVNGDSAIVTSYLQILTPHPTAEPHEVPNHGISEGFRIHRVAANRWELVRTVEGWKIKHRTVRTLDGSEAAREILSGALERYQTKA